MAAAGDGTVTVAEGGVRVDKRLADDRFDHPAVELVVEVDRPTPARIVLIDEVPGGSSSEYVGFHPQFGGDCWRIEDDRLIFERVFEATESCTTIYGLRGADPEAVRAELVAPELEIEPIDAAPDIERQVDEMLGVAPGTAGDGPVAASPEPLPSETSHEPAEAGAGTSAATSPGESTTTAGGDDVMSSPDRDDSSSADLVTRLAEDLRTDTADPADLETVRSAFSGPDRGTEVRIQHLQREVADVAAYTDAIDQFLEAVGTDGELVESFEQALADVREDVAELEASLADVEAELAQMADRLDAVDDLEAQLVDLRGDLEDVERDQAAMQSFTDRFRSLLVELADDEGVEGDPSPPG